MRRPHLRRLVQQAVLVVSVAIGAAGAASGAAFKDAADRVIEVAPGDTKIVPAGPPAQVLLHALVPTRLVGLVEPFKPDHAIYVAPEVAALPIIPMLSRTDAPDAIAKVAGSKPGLVVDYGSISRRYVAAIAKTQSALHVPSALMDGRLTETGRVLTTLGDALGASARARELAETVATVVAHVGPVSQLPDEARVTVYLARGSDGLTAARAGTSFDEPIRLAGGRNVVGGTGETFKRMTIEEVVALKPDVVILSETEALSSPLHDALPKSTKFVLDAGEPYKALTGPPSLNRIVGLAALAAILHPSEVRMPQDDLTRMEAKLFPVPPGLSLPAPLQVR